MNRARRWTFDYLAACDLADGQPLEPGDELGLTWRGELQRPELAPPGNGRRAIVVRVSRNDHGYRASVTVALIDEGRDAREAAGSIAAG